MATLLVSQAYLKDQSLISDNVDFKIITPVIRVVQDIEIQQLLGTNLYDKILTDVAGNVLSGNYKTLVDDYVLPAMVYYIQARIPYALHVRFVNKGLVTKTSTDSQPVSENMFNKVIDEYKNTAQALGTIMVNYIRANTSLFPEYSTNNGIDEMTPNRTANDIDLFIPAMDMLPSNEEVRNIGSGL